MKLRLIIIAALLFVACDGCILGPDAFAGEYTSYAGDRFLVRHYGELDQIFYDTVEVLSVAVTGELIRVTTVDKRVIFIRYPDRLERME